MNLNTISNVHRNRRSFLSLCIKVTKILLFSLSGLTLFLSKRGISEDGMPQGPPSPPIVGDGSSSSPSGKVILNSEFANQIRKFPEVYTVLNEKYDVTVTPEQQEMQVNATEDFLRKILDAKGYKIKAPTGLRISD